ncbi:MAG: type I methionyl aminopeptidase [Myxococcales bacterium]|nr:type I methionyl aminopeptidase [Myxococcales bacterium]MDH5305985.1 type I methionyl aminopeptidase [Myxococcales bacterium]MDH5565526.1 type I methionyl aminopeptidase [Myxococcales bacterium]
MRCVILLAMLVSSRANAVQIKNESNLEAMRRAGRLASECLAWIVEQVEPGMTTLDIDDLQMGFARDRGVKPAPLGYRGFPRSICTSVNEVICHGIPDRNVTLREGDIVGIDVTLIVEGFHGDTAATIAVGQVSEEVAHLLCVTLQAQRRGVEAVRPGARLGDIGAAIQSTVEPEGFSVVRDFVGHGIGRRFHEDPQVPHYGESGRGLRLRPGMTFTVEPMINVGVPDVEILEDGWTAVTGDRQLSAQYEHTLEVTADGVRILTVQNDAGDWEPPGGWWPPGFPGAPGA